MYHEMFPEEFLVMQEEVQRHQALLSNLLQLPKDSPFELKFGEICAFVGIVLDGVYENEQILELCEEVTKRLVASRVELILEVSAPKTLQ